MRGRLACFLIVVALASVPARPSLGTGGLSPLSTELYPRWARFTPDNSGLADLRVLAVIEAADGSLWFVHPSAVSRFDARAWRTFPADVALPEDISTALNEPPALPWEIFGLDSVPIHRAIADSHSATWLAADVGAFRLDPDRWENGIPAFRGMALYQVRDVLRDSYGVLWFAGYDPISGEGSLSGLDPSGRWLFFNAEVEPLVSNQITALAEDAEGGLWAGSVRSGVSRYLGNAWRSWTAADSPLPDDRTLDLQPVDAGRVMLVVTRGGVAQYAIDADAWEVWRPTLDGAAVELDAALAAMDGSLWYGLSGGSYWLTNGDGSLIDIDAPVQDLTQRARDGSLWAVTGNALLRNMPLGDGWSGWSEAALPLPGASHIEADDSGMLWIGAGEGLLRFDPDAESWAIFTTENSGMAEDGAHLAHIDRDGLLVFATDRVYVSTYRPEPPARPRLTLAVDGRPPMPVMGDKPIVLPAGTGQLAFEINTAAWWPTDALAYHTRLEGPGVLVRDVSRAESMAAHRTRVTFSDVTPGEYSFCVYVSDPMLDASAETCARLVIR